jgi:uncharacterized protein
MAREEFERRLKLSSPPDDVWRVVTDVPRLIEWISILEDAETVEELSRYRATLRDRLGIFSLRADLDIRITDHKDANWLRGTAEGEDRQVGSRLAVSLDLSLEAADAGTALTVAGVYEVTGRVATMGASTIHRKADRILEEFFTSLAGELG